jgi:hypothetical protein
MPLAVEQVRESLKDIAEQEQAIVAAVEQTAKTMARLLISQGRTREAKEMQATILQRLEVLHKTVQAMAKNRDVC